MAYFLSGAPTETGIGDGTTATALKEADTATTVVVLTGYGSIATAVDAMRLGATSYLTKPVDAGQIVAAFDGSAAQEHSEPTAQPLARVEWNTFNTSLPTARATCRKPRGVDGS